MEPLWRQSCLLLSLLILPVTFAAFCLWMSRRRQGRLVSYVAWFLLFGFAGLWLLATALSPSGMSRSLAGFLLTAAPVICLGLALTLQKGPPRLPFDTAAMVGCYLYLPLMAAVAVFTRLGPTG